MNISGTLCARPFMMRSLRLPMARAAAAPDIPEHMCTTVPPAKSWFGRPMSVSPELMNPPPQTMCAIGA